MAYTKVVDADGHIKDRGRRWKVNEPGLEYLEIDGKPRIGQR